MIQKIILALSCLFYLSCSKSDNTFRVNTGGEAKEEIQPIAVDDVYNCTINSFVKINNLLVNDSNTKNVTLKIITTNTKGTVQKNNDNSYTYTPTNNFTGTDSFDYEICDTASNNCDTATVTITVAEASSITFNIPTDLKDYYKNVVFTEDANRMFTELQNLSTSKHHTIIYYGSRHSHLLKADEDPSQGTNVILMYTGESKNKSFRQTSGTSTGKFNTEHVYPQSLYAGGVGGFEKDEIVKGDLHHLRYCDAVVNTTRSNNVFTEGSGSAKITNGKWYPGDEWKGDVARMIFYLNIRYDESIAKVGTLETFLKWNKEDPISVIEMQRNNVIENAQGNRNPFIDNPYLATLIWGGMEAENKWE